MLKSNFPQPDDSDKEVILCLESQIIPAWERYGMDHLAVSANSLKGFRSQPLPEQIRTWAKKRRGKRVIKRPDVKNVNTVIESWPDDDLISSRLPVLMYVKEGEAEFQLGDYVAMCPREHFLLLSPGIPQPAGSSPHLEEPRQGKNCEVWWFRPGGHNDFVALNTCYSVGEEHLYSDHYYIVDDVQVAQIFHVFVREAMDKHPDYIKITSALFQAFLHLFLREIKAGRYYDRGAGKLLRPASGSDSPISLARQYIEKNLNRPLTIEVVARAVFMTKTSFTRQFRQETGQTFREYLMDRRLEEAKHWLLGESCSVDVVCKFVGLKSSRFHQLFKQRFGMTPTEFRAQYRNV